MVRFASVSMQDKATLTTDVGCCYQLYIVWIHSTGPSLVIGFPDTKDVILKCVEMYLAVDIPIGLQSIQRKLDCKTVYGVLHSLYSNHIFILRLAFTVVVIFIIFLQFTDNLILKGFVCYLEVIKILDIHILLIHREWQTKN